MNKKILISIIIGIIIIVGIGIFFVFQKPAFPEPQTGKCGDGICGPAEKANPNLCPGDCQRQTTSSPSTSTTSTMPAAPTQHPLYIFFVMHVEPDGKIGEGSQMSNANYQNIKNTVLKVAETLEKHGMRGNFEIVYRVLTDAKTYEGTNSFINQLKTKGHSINLHSHHWMIFNNQNECQSLCGTTCFPLQEFPEAGSFGKSGVTCYTGEGGPEDGLKALKALGISDNIVVALKSFAKTDIIDGGFGFSRAANYLEGKIVNDNENPEDKNPIRFKDCAEFGHGDNQWYSETGNFLHPWRPDYENRDVCKNNPDGKILYIDQTNPSWMFEATGWVHSVLTKEHFNALRDRVKNALNHLSSEQINAWGWPQHNTEYQVDFNGPYDQTAIDALDGFLTDIDNYKYKTQGIVKYKTLEEIYNEYVKWENTNR